MAIVLDAHVTKHTNTRFNIAVKYHMSERLSSFPPCSTHSTQLF